jgi:hypothetical protein
MKQTEVRHPAQFALCIAIYAAAVIAYSIMAYTDQKTLLMAELDRQLLLSAKSLKFLLAPDFHDRAVDKDSISRDEETKNRIAISDFAADSGFKWVYTLVQKDGKYYFSAPTVSAEELKERPSWYFYPYDDIPEEFKQAYNEKKTVFVEYTDQWGTFRSVALPQVSPGGRTYLACADCEISHVKSMLQKDLKKSVGISLFFLVCSIPFILFFRGTFRAHAAELEKINAELTLHKTHLEVLVQERTADLEQEKRNLEEALSTVKLLSGLLPICASCKKIRDDRGYWNRIEKYIEEHSEAEFTHGLCPDCVEKLYPGLLKK